MLPVFPLPVSERVEARSFHQARSLPLASVMTPDDVMGALRSAEVTIRVQYIVHVTNPIWLIAKIFKK